jgi:hypothetical protein
MTFANTLAATIDVAPANHLHELSRQVWQAWSSGTLDDDEAQAAAVRIAERRKGGIAGYGGGRNNAPATFLRAHVSLPKLPKRKTQRSPEKQRSIERRRRLAASGGLPPRIAEHFTVSEQAALRIVLDAVKRNGICGLCIDAIAAMAGTCRTVVKTATRKARLLGLLLVRERRRAGQRSLTNLVSVIMHEVRRWLRMPDKGSAARRDLKPGIRGGQKNAPYPLDGAG